MIMADQDYDGSHIKGLLISCFQKKFPGLLKHTDFLKATGAKKPVEKPSY